MGFVQSVNIPDFAKVVISLWFRVPSASISAAASQFTTSNVAGDWSTGFDFNLPGIIPLLTFGNNPTFTSDLGSSKMSPSFIGICCGDQNPSTSYNFGSPTLCAKIGYATGGGTSGGPDYPDYFNIGAMTEPHLYSYGDLDPQFIPVSADQWHHLLVSFDMTSGVASSVSGSTISFSTACKFYWALDDVNYDGRYLWPSATRAYAGQGGPNDIVSDWSFFISDPGTSSYSFGAGAIPVDGNAFGIPSDSSNTSYIYDVRMTDLQVFTDVVLDTSVESNRRAFITADGHPASPALASALLSKTPEILFQTSSDWISGNNRGTAGPFDVTGTIIPVTPAP
jgi:hypothetical protein